MRTAAQWTELQLGRDAALVLGWRRGSRLSAGRLNLARDMNQALRQRAQAALDDLRRRQVRGYDPSAHLETDEVFFLSVDDLPRRPKRRRRGRQPKVIVDQVDDQEEASELIEILSAPGYLDPLGPDTLRGQSFLFYAVVFGSRGSVVAFLKRHNPGVVLKPGRLLGLFGDAITHIEEPVLVFEPDFDLIIDGDELAALTPSALTRIFVDLEVAAAAVPAHVEALRSSALMFAEGTLAVITTACQKRRLLAGRLQALIATDHLGTLTVEMVNDYATSLEEDPSRFIVDGEISVSEEDVPALLDVLDQRHYRGGYDQLLRRADRTSVVS